jgi:hypothetical protein
MVHFLESGSMLWECCCFVGSLGGPMKFGPPHAESKPENYRTRLIDALQFERHKSDTDLPEGHDGYDNATKRRTLQNWYHVLVDYSTRALTYETDRPIAIKGLVDHVHSVTGFNYYHGIWEEDAVRGLLWERRNRQLDLLRQSPISLEEQFRIPTWSWLSTLGPIQTCTSNDEDLNPPLFEDTRHVRPIIDHKLESLVHNLQFSEAMPSITLTGLVREINWSALRGYAPLLPPAYSLVSIPRGLRVHLEELKLGDSVWQNTKERKGEFAWVSLDYPSERSAMTDSTVLLLALTNYYGLVLQRSRMDRRSYERIGLFRRPGREDALHYLGEKFEDKEVTLV